MKILPLNKEIDDTKSKLTIKSNSVTLTLVKRTQEHWDDLKNKPSPFKKPNLEKNEDPQASLINMMKEMYDSGDDDMKRMIAQSWSKAQEENVKK